ncbi:MAG TPA: SemiSWEET transporter [Geomonas sp.]|nr:SemiSWEET transporter [Geomonas sp.]
MNLVHAIGFFAGLLTSGAAVPQVLQTWRTKHARDLSMSQLVMLCIGMLLWLIYGILLGDLPLIAANLFSICCYAALIVMKLRYDRKDSAACLQAVE